MMIDMKILHFHPDERMAARFVYPLIEAERDHGHTSELVTSKNKSQASTLQIAYEISLRNLLFFPIAFVQIWRVIRNRKPDIVVSHNTTSALIPLLVAFLMRVKVRVYFNHGVPYVGYTGVVRWLLILLEVVNCKLASSVVTVSDDMINLLMEIMPNIRPKLIMNGSACGIDLNLYNRNLYEKSLWRSRNLISNDDTVVAFVGRPERRKGFEKALHIWTNFLKEARFKLVLCGATQSDVLSYLPAIPSNVICLGFVDNIPEVLSNVDGLLLPSLHEGLSYAVLEAMACGCPIIANDIPGVRSLVESGVHGYLVKENSMITYANIIRILHADRPHFDEMRYQSVARASIYSRKLFLPAYLSYLDGLGQTRKN